MKDTEVPILQSVCFPGSKREMAGSSEQPVKEASGVQEPVLQVMRMHEDAVLPKRGSALAAGYDLSACQSCEVAKGGRAVVKTGLKVAIPAGCYGRVAPRSGLAVKRGIDVGAGVVDADYRGELGVVLFNFGDEAFEVKPGDRVAQLILERISTPSVMEVQSLKETVRGEGGFGSTGVGKSG